MEKSSVVPPSALVPNDPGSNAQLSVLGAASSSTPSPWQLSRSIRGPTPATEEQLQSRAVAFVLIFFLKAWKSNEKINKNNCLSTWFIARATNYILLCLAITRVFMHVLWRREFAEGLQKSNQTGTSRTWPSGYASGQSDTEQPGSGSYIAAFVGEALGEGLLLWAVRYGPASGQEMVSSPGFRPARGAEVLGAAGPFTEGLQGYMPEFLHLL